MRLHPVTSIQQHITQKGRSSSCPSLAMLLNTDAKAMRDITSKPSVSLYEKLSTCPALNKPF